MCIEKDHLAWSNSKRASSNENAIKDLQGFSLRPTLRLLCELRAKPDLYKATSSRARFAVVMNDRWPTNQCEDALRHHEPSEAQLWQSYVENREGGFTTRGMRAQCRWSRGEENYDKAAV